MPARGLVVLAALVEGSDHHYGQDDHGHHSLPGFDGTPVTWRSLLALVVAFSLGLAAVLTGIGIALVYAGRRLSRFWQPGAGRLLRVLPAMSASAVIVAGLLITLRAMGQTGVPVV